MKRLLTSALALLITASTTFAVEESNWGQIKAQITHAEDGRTFVTFSPPATQQAAKVAAIPAEGRSVSKVFSTGKASIAIEETNGAGKYDNLKIGFHVPEGALTAPVEITMTVYGNTLEDLVVAFEPGGLTFLQEATLALWLGKDLVHTPLSEIKAWHQYSDYTVEEAYPSQAYPFVRSSKTTVTIMIAVFGFSRYSTGGGW